MAQAKPTLSSDPGPRFQACRRAALEPLRKAADEGAQGHPEEPPTDQVLAEILQLLERERFLRRPG